MRKLKILGVFVAALAFGAFAVAGASASLWLVGGKTPTAAVSAPLHGKFTLIHAGGTLGSAKAECSGLLIGTVEEKESKITLAENLSGTEKDLIGNCTTISGFCLGAVFHVTFLAWHGILINIGTKTWYEILRWGIVILCSFGIQVECSGKIKAEFEGNGANGARIGFKGVESGEMECSDGGKGTLESTGDEVLGASIS